jgi:two-component sensor histidine kinase
MHKLLRRQIARAFGGAGEVPDLPGMRDFLAAVDEAYAAADEDRAMLERSLDITSSIMLKKNRELRAAMETIAEARDRAERDDREKGLLLREIHHRVKNNLQVIVSLLNLQADAKDVEGYRAFIVEATGRIMSMAMVHEMLYENGDFSALDFSAYAERIARSAARSSESDPDLDLSLARVLLPLDQAVPCGLILNEALTNSFKYGRGEDGSARVSMRLEAEGARMRMEIGDKGPGFPPGFAESGGLGHTLMASLAAQIQGEIRFENRGGALVSLELERA